MMGTSELHGQGNSQGQDLCTHACVYGFFPQISLNPRFRLDFKAALLPL